MTPKGTMKRALLVLAAMAWTVPAGAQGVHRCVDAAGHVYYYGAQPPAGVTCVEEKQIEMKPPAESEQERARDERGKAVDDAAREASMKAICARAIRAKLITPGSASFNLWPDGRYTIVGYVDSQNKLGAYLRGSVKCEFSMSGTLQRANLYHD